MYQRENSQNTKNDRHHTVFSNSLPKIYTRTGDRGTSVLLSTGTKRLPKDSLVFDVLGTLDELSSVIGIILSTSSSSSASIRSQLENIQHDLFDIGSCVAANNASSRFTFNDSTLVENFEKQIDQMTRELPELRNFILPGGGSLTASHVHLARAVCRRGERLMTKWLNQRTDEEKQTQQATTMGIYLNRLSDYFFTLARYITYKEGHQEIIYHKRI